MKRFCLPAMLFVLLFSQLTGSTMAGDAASYTPPGTYSNSNVDMHGYGITNASQVQTNILYDRDNTSYYINPAGTSNVSRLDAAQLRPSIIYDKDNTAYYVNPAGTSKLAAINLGGVTMTSWPSSGGNCRVCLKGNFLYYPFQMEVCDDNPSDNIYSPNMALTDGEYGDPSIAIRIVCD